MRRSEVREVLFMLLFRTEFNSQEEMPEQIQLFFDVNIAGEEDEEESGIADTDRDYIVNRGNSILNKMDEIDAAISQKATGWTIERMGKVDLAIIRLAVYEILFDESIPVSVSINEAVELAKKYGREESGSFVNGVLAKFAK